MNFSARQRTRPLEGCWINSRRPQVGERDVGKPRQGALQSQTDWLWPRLWRVSSQARLLHPEPSIQVSNWNHIWSLRGVLAAVYTKNINVPSLQRHTLCEGFYCSTSRSHILQVVRNTDVWQWKLSLCLFGLLQVSRDYLGPSFHRGHRYVVSGHLGCNVVPRHSALPWQEWIWYGKYYLKFTLCLFIKFRFIFYWNNQHDLIYLCLYSDNVMNLYCIYSALFNLWTLLHIL